MKTLVVVLFTLSAALLGQAQPRNGSSPEPNPQYFPAGVFGTAAPSFTEKWYSGTLRALQEPSLFALRSDHSLQVYRFLWLPSFHRPISVRLTINVDGSSSIVTRSVDSHAGLLTKPASDTEKLILDATIPVDRAETQKVLEQLERLTFWTMPTDEKEAQEAPKGQTVLRLDGSEWVLEGIRQGEYHIVDRWSPRDNSYAQLCKYLLRLGKIETALY